MTKTTTEGNCKGLTDGAQQAASLRRVPGFALWLRVEQENRRAASRRFELASCKRPQDHACSRRLSSKAAAAPARTDGRKVKSKDGKVDGEIFGTPAAKSKFAKLQIGMSRTAPRS